MGEVGRVAALRNVVGKRFVGVAGAGLHVTYIELISSERSLHLRNPFWQLSHKLLIEERPFAAPAIAQTDYDGNWNVTVITKTGSCQPTTSYPLVVADGNVSGAADLSGSVGRNGMVRASLRGAHANGQLSGNAGSGRWNSASAGMPCSGRWTATRQ
jgi:hypothetical protein